MKRHRLPNRTWSRGGSQAWEPFLLVSSRAKSPLGRAVEFLILLGTAIMLVGCACSAGIDKATPSPSPVSTAGPTATIRLGRTAAAAATQLPPVTTVPLPGPTPDRPGAPQRLVIPELEREIPVVPVGWHLEHRDDGARGVWETVSGAAGHHRGSADPGQPGNCVISGHSSNAGGAVLNGLETLAIGDTIELYTVAGDRYVYEITDMLQLDELGASTAERREHARWLDPTEDPVLTLVTCWPAWSYTHRIVVRAKLK